MSNDYSANQISNGVKPLSEYKHLFFDLDDTLTPTRTPMAPDMQELLRGLPVDCIAVSGADHTQMSTQLCGVPFFHLTQNGNHAFDLEGNELWKNTLTEEERNDVLAHMSTVLACSDYDVSNPTDLIEDRGSQISLSMIGHHEVLEKKKAYDPHGLVRAALLERAPFSSKRMDVRIAGTATLDYTKRGLNKGTNVRRLIEQMGWNPDECVYFGDKLMPGGNDETVIGVIDTIAVISDTDTYEKLKAAFG